MDLHDFYIGKSFDAYEYFGAHPFQKDGKDGFYFRVYAPAAQRIEVIGQWNGWGQKREEMYQEGLSGIFQCFCPGAKEGDMYKFRITGSDGRTLDKADPYAFGAELRPGTASVVRKIDDYKFHDRKWMESRNRDYNKPFNIYEVHCGSWKKKLGQVSKKTDWYSYEELGGLLIPYVKELGFTHIEFLPLMEHPSDESWGYQVSGFFCPTARYGTAASLKRLIDDCHQAGLGVILDFVPVHFVANDYCLLRFDGTALYEYPNNDTGFSEWGSCNFNFYRGDVISFLQSSAYYWLKEFHFDGLRMDAVSNIIYWQGNSSRGLNEGGIRFLQNMNAGLKEKIPSALLIAEDSSNYLKVTAPVEFGGLGFDYKWDMGWMNDTLNFFSMRPEDRPASYGTLCFSMEYFYNELYLLPFSHDETVHGKKTIVDKMYGSYEEKFSQCRALYLYMFAHPGKKLNFMGNELGQLREWDESRELDWDILRYPIHDSFRCFFQTLQLLYLELPQLSENDYNREYFRWIDTDQKQACIYAFLRGSLKNPILFLLNPMPKSQPRIRFRLPEGTPKGVKLKELLNSDEQRFSGEGIVNTGENTNGEPGISPDDSGIYTIQLNGYSAGLFGIEGC